MMDIIKLKYSLTVANVAAYRTSNIDKVLAFAKKGMNENQILAVLFDKFS